VNEASNIDDAFTPPWSAQQYREAAGAKIRLLRQKAKLSTRQVAERASMSQSKVMRIESGRLLSNSLDLDLLFGIFRPDEDERRGVLSDVQVASTLEQPLADFLVHSPQRHNQELYDELTKRASVFKKFDGVVVPGLLQTAEYALSQFRRSFLRVDDEFLAGAVRRRLQRQEALGDQSKRYFFLITEAALRYRYVPLKALRSQYQQLISMSTLSNVSLGVLPSDAEMAHWPRTSFVIFDGRFLTLDVGVGTVASGSMNMVNEHLEVFESFERSAVWHEKARSFLRQLDYELSCEADHVVDLTGYAGVVESQ
jgi:transcriptional regulator with XRE-family HTH domain